MMKSPLAAVPACLSIFIVRSAIGRAFSERSLERFLTLFGLGALGGAGVAILFVVIATLITGNGAGPLAAILYVPLGFSIGAIGGTILWSYRYGSPTPSANQRKR